MCQKFKNGTQIESILRKDRTRKKAVTVEFIGKAIAIYNVQNQDRDITVVYSIVFITLIGNAI